MSQNTEGSLCGGQFVVSMNALDELKDTSALSLGHSHAQDRRLEMKPGFPFPHEEDTCSLLDDSRV